MARSHGWSVLAEKALELSALALVVRAIAPGRAKSRNAAAEPVPEPPRRTVASEAAAAPSALEFITEGDGDGATYYHAADAVGEIYAGFYADGRVRLAGGAHRFAGVVQSGHAELLDVANNLWSELFVRVAPDGRVQLELRGGPYDARIFTCEALHP